MASVATLRAEHAEGHAAAVRMVRLADPGDQSAFACEAAIVADGGEAVVAAALRELATATEVALRTAKSRRASGPTSATIEVLDAVPEAIRRPLGIGAGHGYAVTWISIQKAVAETVDKGGAVERHDPPLVQEERILLVGR